MLLISVRKNCAMLTKGPVASEECKLARACLLLDQIKREKGVWWMPWQ